ncbi:hypothetical protein X474_26605 [Dethiosulfatarculus sandiegensis]|uniref:Uncharacterized protein n=1 Tax=Dethiosulfatarculus sandiegensis TaxID=1429043 RepID=A0A0D2G7Q8_9BACT|nr:hypothetical protein X474_26605 [Dethiosulfatarculus sandiegensis]
MFFNHPPLSRPYPAAQAREGGVRVLRLAWAGKRERGKKSPV